MKFIVSVILTALLGFSLGLYLDWWSIAVAAFLIGWVIRLKPGFAWLAGFLGIFILWGGLAYWIDEQNRQLLSVKIAQLLPLNGNRYLLILITAFVGALVAGFAALTGSYVHKLRKQ